MPASPTKRKRTVRPVAPAAATKAPSIAQQVGDLAWAGQHAQAIEVASAALGKTNLSAGSRLDLLDLRAESYLAQGELARASDDTQAMLGIAKTARSAAFKAQALNRKALVQMRKGELRASVD